MCLLAIYMSSLEKCLCLQPTFWLSCFWYWAVWTISVFWKLILYQLHCLQILSTSLYITFCLWFFFFFAVQKLLSFIRFHMFIFAFISIALGDWPEKALLQSISDIVLPMSSSRSFLVSCLLFKFFHFEFVYAVWKSIITSLLYMQLSRCLNTTFWRHAFLHCIFSLPFSKINWL